MARRHVIPAVLQDFLGTFTSRYSDLDGYWLFGFLVEDLDETSIDLLDQPDGGRVGVGLRRPDLESRSLRAR